MKMLQRDEGSVVFVPVLQGAPNLDRRGAQECPDSVPMICK